MIGLAFATAASPHCRLLSPLATTRLQEVVHDQHGHDRVLSTCISIGLLIFGGMAIGYS